jgi:hypothetical protein
MTGATKNRISGTIITASSSGARRRAPQHNSLMWGFYGALNKSRLAKIIALGYEGCLGHQYQDNGEGLGRALMRIAPIWKPGKNPLPYN